jgi:hypothetical protein
MHTHTGSAADRLANEIALGGKCSEKSMEDVRRNCNLSKKIYVKL